MRGFSPAEIQLLEQGPFPGRIDPWAEAARYFRPIRASMIDALLSKLREPLLERGYVAGRETSLQIAAGREPDIYVQHSDRPEPTLRYHEYELAAAEVMAEVGVVVDDEIDLQTLHIRSGDTGTLVTVVEIVSPGNKTRPHEIEAYRVRRSRLCLERGVNVVEIDFTRSIKRLTENSATTTHPYHIAIFLPLEPVVIIGIEREQSLPRIALPLREEVIPVDLHPAYARAYAITSTAWHIHHEGRYTEADLPFLTTLSDEQRHQALTAVEHWQQKLASLRQNGQ